MSLSAISRRLIVLVYCFACMQPTEADDVQEQLLKVHRHKLKQQEEALLQMQHEIQLQLQNLYVQQHKLEASGGSADNRDIGGYEYPSYCANCLGDTFEPINKNLLSSEFSRKADGTRKASQSESELNQLSDHRRLEAIKQQILLKLNLNEKPNVTSSIPKQLILDTLHRAGERDFGQMHMMQANDDPIVEKLQQLKMRSFNGSDDAEFFGERDVEGGGGSSDDDSEFDDFYGRTREIITFAERGEFEFGFKFYLKSRFKIY